MSIMNIIGLLGGLALFLYGMNSLGEGLSRLSGSKLESILAKITSNKIRGVLLGMVVTTIIQSSSATTVMVVGLVNSGLLKLSQSIGVIMGANIGTTITSWILSLSALSGDSILVQLFKAGSIAAILAFIGILMNMQKKSKKHQLIGYVLVSFGILLFGMETMSSAVKPLAELPQFKEVFTIFSNPILGLLLGAAVTALVQSSSASVGILQALSNSGAITFGATIPIILGQNIGTCVTAMLSSIGAKKNAKRAAIVHLLFNIIGTIMFMILFYSLNYFIRFSFLSSTVNAVNIALVHTTFNILATLVLLPFTKGLEMLARRIVPDRPEEMSSAQKQYAEDFKLLDTRFLDKPSFAVEQAHQVMINMGQLAKRSLSKSIDLIFNYDFDVYSEVEALENRLDCYEDELGSYLVKISSEQLNVADSHKLTIMLHTINDFERISDHAINIAMAARKSKEAKDDFSKSALNEIQVYTSAIHEILDMSLDVFNDFNIEMAKEVEPLEQVIDKLTEEIEKRHIKRVKKGKCTMSMGMILSDILTALERVSDHCSNLAVRIIQVNEDNYETHEYLHDLEKNDPDFSATYDKYLLKYSVKNIKKSSRVFENESNS